MEPSRNRKYEIYSFLEKEFLNADDITFKNIANHYYKQYGYGAGNYLINTYRAWKSGYTKVSSQTFGRIVTFMPKFLSDEKRFFILKTEIQNYLDEHIKKHRFLSELTIKEVWETFVELQNVILKFGEIELHWFIGNNIFTPELVNHYLMICRYVMNQQILQHYNHVKGDLQLITDRLSTFPGIVSKSYYRLEVFDKRINLSEIKNEVKELHDLKKVEFNLDESFKKFGERYFLDELMKLSFIEKMKSENAPLNKNDLDMFLNHYLDIIKQNNSMITMKATFNGMGGQYEILLEWAPRIKALKMIILEIFWLLIGIAAIVGILIGMFVFKQWWLVIVALFLFLSTQEFYSETGHRIKKIKQALNQIKLYGK